VTEITVTYSKEMQDGSWSWSTLSAESFPELAGKPSYRDDKRTCVLPVKLKPNTTYAIWLNSAKFTNFKDATGKPAVPYLLVFKTKP
jgi:RNA polymerase sigma-70 factor (ECF subfamily)